MAPTLRALLLIAFLCGSHIAALSALAVLSPDYPGRIIVGAIVGGALAVPIAIKSLRIWDGRMQ